MKSLITILLLSTSVNANNLQNWLEGEVQSHQENLVLVEQESLGNDTFLNLIRVRIRATISFELPLVAKGKIRPEIELYYTR
ncbi:MAG: hypothetical protein NXH75_10585 [Halobacteriovoraceae bacterium]|nr:hypothetical protein [Halobacteriovoraceae bacterium]